MKRRQKMTWYLCGMISAVLVVQLLSPALASAKRSIDVYNNGVSIYIDDVKLNPTNVNGNPVDIFVYNGTTYVPIRAISQGFGKPVLYDSQTKNVYIGRHSADKPTVWLKDMTYFTCSGSYYTLMNGLKDNLGNSRDNVITLDDGSSTVTQNTGSHTYLLNGQYSKLTGTLFQRFEYRSNTATNYIEVFGDGNLLGRYTVTGGKYPVDFSVNVSGVLQLEIVISVWGYGAYAAAGVADLGLWT